MQTERTVQVTANGETRRVPYGTPVGELAPEAGCDAAGLPFLGVLVNNDLVTLSYPIEVDSRLEFVTLMHRQGWRIYRNSLAFLLGKAMHELHPGAEFTVEHSLGTGFYCTFARADRPGLTEEELAAVDAHLRALVKADLPIERVKIAFEEAVRRFEEAGQTDQYNLLRFRNPPKVVVYDCGGYTDLAHSVLAVRTGALEHFRLIANPPGFVIQFPEREGPPTLAPFEPQPYLFKIFQEHKEWGRILGVRTVGDLNRLTAAREIDEIVRIAEAFHEKNIARIADHIFQNRDRLRWILIAGPSSSGKTTFTKRLAVQLRVCGLRPASISVDDYFVDRERTPKDENGEWDFEHLETVDLAFFNEHLERLDRGEEVEAPGFNFETGQREFRGKTLRFEPDQPVLVEGIHCLNPRLTEAVPASHKYKIYVSALTQLNLDFHNRIATTDNRLLRRMIRDHQFRGQDALRTLGMWPSVRRGEKRWIFPYQNEADTAFNSALDYELGVLKNMAEPLLREVKPHHEQYAEARRLLAFLESFLPIPPYHVPPTSLLREFIGRSSFRY